MVPRPQLSAWVTRPLNEADSTSASPSSSKSAANTLRAACHAIRPGGVVSVVGLFLQDPGVEPLALFLKEGTLAWSNCYQRGPEAADFDEAVQILDAEREGLQALLTHTVPLNEIERGFSLASNKKAGVVKVAVVP